MLLFSLGVEGHGLWVVGCGLWVVGGGLWVVGCKHAPQQQIPF